MTATNPSSLVEGPYATYDFTTTAVIWAAAMVNLKIDLTSRLAYGIWNGSQHRKEQDHEQQQAPILA